MIGYRFPSIGGILCLLLQVVLINESQQASLSQDLTSDLHQELMSDQQENKRAAEFPLGTVNQDENPEGSYIVLMSSNTISVAQLPMILHGNITEIYRLTGDRTQELDLEDEDPSEYDDEDARVAEAADVLERKHRPQHRENEPRADAREYEQMPFTMTVNSTASLGKTEWQQIASDERDREEIWPPQQTTQTNPNRKDTSNEEGVGKDLGRPRKKRRSNSSNHGEESSANESSAAFGTVISTSDAQTRSRINRAEPPDAQNVTSARTSNALQQQNRASEGTTGMNTPAEDDNKTNRRPSSISPAQAAAMLAGPSAIQNRKIEFSDFDVQMALGYAFAADTAGRIHRFKLLTRTQSSTLDPMGTLALSSQAKTRPLNSENDEANVIDAGASSGFGSRRSNDSGLINSRLNSNSPEATGNSGHHDNQYNHHVGEHRQREISDDINKLGGRPDSDVTHEQFDDGRQHPTISGVQSVLASIVGPPHASPISGYSRAADDHSNTVRDGSSKPQVIWSRIKHSSAHRRPAHARVRAPAQSTELNETRRQQLVTDAEGALPQRDSNQMVGEKITARGTTKHPQQTGGKDESRNEALPRSFPESGSQQLVSHRTEIAVDWLNNLLFVLDKCRLLVMDFDGGNELVLIDDFNAHNRPVDIKVDPINDFLFWLQRGKFHNTIYKLDLSVLSMPSATQKLVSNTLRLRHSLGASENISNYDAGELVPLVSRHYAHPIITNLPRQTNIFTIDHKHSRIYVPLIPIIADIDRAGFDSEKSRHDEAEVFAFSDDATHLNSTELDGIFSDGKNCTNAGSSARESQILAYNLDGTDVGPFRTAGERGHIGGLDDIQDLALDSEHDLLYWLTNSGRDLVEEFKENGTIQPAQHNLFGKTYSKMLYFDTRGFSQPVTSKSRFNVRKIIHILSSSISSNRPTRSEGAVSSDEDSLAYSLKVRQNDRDPTRLARNAPFIILGATCLVVVSILLIYAFIFQSPRNVVSNVDVCVDGSMSGGGSTMGESQEGSNQSGFINSTTISRWITGPSVRSSDTSTFNRDPSGTNAQLDAYDIESATYDASNAIDEHYRESINNGDQLHRQLANISEWPSNMLDKSNKLYVPVEVLQDEALSSIRRVSIDQLEIEKKSPLGEGHFGTVLQGTILCTLHEKSFLLEKSHVSAPLTAPISPDSLALPARHKTIAISSVSSGHGSSSASCEFNTANSCTGASKDDYLTPKLNSTSSDYCAEIPDGPLRDQSCISYGEGANISLNDSVTKEDTKLKVAIKKLKDNASAEEKRDFLQEAKLLANFDHPNIVHLIGICLDRGSTLIVMELMLGGDLIRYMQENTPNSLNNFTDRLTYDDLLKICLDIANGCCYLEDMDYIHRDLAARNCLVSSRKREERIVKLADFGLARDIYKDSYYKKLNDSAMPLKWMAPECLIEQKFTKKSDVWSFGVVMWEVLSYCQEKPYGSVEPFFMKEHLASGARLRRPDNCDDNMYRLMNWCWQMDPENRPTFHECRSMLIEIRGGMKVL